ncbi:MAG TPA: hypothetical protein VMT76_15920 [Puia sp.]|nr:hypothetical protein [Puia sp.]
MPPSTRSANLLATYCSETNIINYKKVDIGPSGLRENLRLNAGYHIPARGTAVENNY